MSSSSLLRKLHIAHVPTRGLLYQGLNFPIEEREKMSTVKQKAATIHCSCICLG
jgi:hypothetical protein